MNTKVIKLDGITTGFSNVPEGSVVHDGQLYKTLELAKVNNKRGGREIVLVGNGSQIAYECLHQKKEGVWEYRRPGEIIIFEEQPNIIVTNIEYIIFENGDTERTDPSIGIKKSKEFFKIVKKSFEGLILKKKLRSMKNNKHIYVNIKNSTEKIHILYNSQIMDINMIRKENGLRCIPYDKSMDKFCTIFIYSTKDKDDKSEEKFHELMHDIYSILIENYSNLNPRFKVVNYNGTIYDKFDFKGKDD